MPKGIFCMAKNLTEVAENMNFDQRKEFYHLTSYRGKVLIFMIAFLYDLATLFFYFAAQKAGLSITNRKT